MLWPGNIEVDQGTGIQQCYLLRLFNYGELAVTRNHVSMACLGAWKPKMPGVHEKVPGILMLCGMT